MTITADVTRGVVLDHRYRLERVIGQGGMATVYQAHDLVLGRGVAIKIFPPVAEGADDLRRHQAEMRVLARMSHPGLVTLHDAGSAHAGGPMEQTYLVMELVTGPSLAELLKQGPLTPAQVALLGRETSEALAAVHRADVVHRDVKPANILLVDRHSLDVDGGADRAVSTGPLVKLADFGIARLSDGARLTMTGTTLGTATYLSPEQAAGGAVGPPTDVYALGLVLLECLTGRKAFTGTIVEVAAARLNTAPPIPADLDPSWAELLAGMTRRRPEERFTSAEVALALSTILQGEPTGAATDGTGPPPEQTRRYSTDELRGDVGPAGRAGAVRPGATVRRGGRGRPVGVLVTGAAALVLAVGALVVTEVAQGTAEVSVEPTYPQVDGSLGEALEALQRSVQP